MNIRFGSYEYVLAPNATIQELGKNLSIQILAENVNFEELESVLKNPDNLNEIVILDDNNQPQQYIYGYSKLDNIHKNYHVLYWTETVEHMVPENIDSQTGNITPSKIESEIIEHYADIFYISLIKPSLEDQVKINTANIEFLAIMSNIDLE